MSDFLTGICRIYRISDDAESTASILLAFLLKLEVSTGDQGLRYFEKCTKLLNLAKYGNIGAKSSQL